MPTASRDTAPQERRRRGGAERGMKVAVQRFVRFCLWPIMAVTELLLLVAGWVCAIVHPPTAERIVRLAERLPDPKWYWPNASGEGREV